MPDRAERTLNMKCASDFRQAAREALRGKWGIAILVGLLAVILGGEGFPQRRDQLPAVGVPVVFTTPSANSSMEI